MAAELEDLVDVETTIIRGCGGIFDVVVDGTLVFSKNETGRFPEPGEIRSLIGK